MNAICQNAHGIMDEFASAHLRSRPRHVLPAAEVRDAVAGFVERMGYPDVDARSVTQSVRRLGWMVRRTRTGTAYFGVELANLPKCGVTSAP